MGWVLRAAVVTVLAFVCAIVVLGYGGKQLRSITSSAHSIASRGRSALSSGRTLAQGTPAVGSRASVKDCLAKHKATLSPGGSPSIDFHLTIRNALTFKLGKDDLGIVDVEKTPAAAREAEREIARADRLNGYGKPAKTDAFSRTLLQNRYLVIKNVFVLWATFEPKAQSRRIVDTCIRTGK